MKLVAKVVAAERKAYVVVDSSVDTIRCNMVKESTGKYTIVLKDKVPNCPKKYWTIGDLVDGEYELDTDAVVTRAKNSEPKTQGIIVGSVASRLKRDLDMLAATDKVSDEEYAAIEAVIQPIIDRLEGDEEQRKIDNKIAVLLAQVKELEALRNGLKVDVE